MPTYKTRGHSYLICPELLALDARHGEHPSRWPLCRRGVTCGRAHDHEEQLIDTEGHTVNDFYWIEGCRPPTADEHPTCDFCGRRLVHTDLDDLYGAEHMVSDSSAERGLE